MYQLLIILQAFLMNWYIAKIVFSIKTEQQTHQQFDEQLRLINAYSTEEALLKARMIGIAEEDCFENHKQQRVNWEFINVAELIPLQKLEDGIEVYSFIHETDDDTAFVRFIHQRAVALRTMAEPALINF